MSAANACTDKQPTAHRQKSRAEPGRWLRPPARASVSRLSAPRQSLLSVRSLPRSPSHRATLRVFCRFCQSLPRPEPPAQAAAAVEAPAARHRRPASKLTRRAPWLALPASRGLAWCCPLLPNLSASVMWLCGVKLRAWTAHGLRGLRVAAEETRCSVHVPLPRAQHRAQMPAGTARGPEPAQAFRRYRCAGRCRRSPAHAPLPL